MKVCVLLAAYKGERYIEAQIFSILSQKESDIDIDIFVRVDGTYDKTHELIERLSNEYDNITYLRGEANSSSGNNFVSQIISTDFGKYDYVCLSDQDDYWRSDRLSFVIQRMRQECSSCFSSNFYSFSHSGKMRLGRYNKLTEVDHFFQCAGPGCSFVLTVAAMNFIKAEVQNNQQLLQVSAHDWLIYFLLRINDFVWTYDREGLIFYRQHSSNIAGENRGFVAKLRRLKFLFAGWYGSDLVLLHHYAELKGLKPRHFNPFKCRRSYLESFILWVIYKFFLQKRVKY